MPIRRLGMRMVSALVVIAGCTTGCSAVWDRPYGSPYAERPAPAPRAQPPARPVDVPPVTEPAQRPADGDVVPVEDRRMFEEVNRVRAQLRLPPFRWNDRLHAAAREHSDDQRRCGKMSHSSRDPAKADLADRLRTAGYGPAAKWAEVVAWGYEGPASVVQGWMNSRGHRKILVDSELTEAGFARVGDYFTGNFGTPRGR